MNDDQMIFDLEKKAEPAHRTLVVLRHGKDDHVDGEWRLTAEGEEMARNCAATIREAVGSRQVVIYTSELTRAVSTGQIIAEELGGSVSSVPWLSSDDYPPLLRPKVDEELRALPEGSVMILVTHQPQVDKLSGWKKSPHCQPYIEDVSD
jgi:broad specificity phosphatase PhoE